MRKVVLVLVVAGLLVCATSAQAFWRPIARRFDGDPDEFESCRVHDEADARVVPPEGSAASGRRTIREGTSHRSQKIREARCLSIQFSGRRFFLEW